MAWKSDIHLVRTADRPVFKSVESVPDPRGPGTSLHFFVGAAVAVQETLELQMHPNLIPLVSP